MSGHRSLPVRHTRSLLLSTVGLRSLGIHITHSSLHASKTHRALSLLVRGRLDLTSALGERLVGA